MVAGADVVRRGDLARWLAVIYSDVYGQPRDDPRLTALIAGQADPVAIG